MTKADRARLDACAKDLKAKLIFDVEYGQTPYSNLHDRELHLLPDVHGPKGGSFMEAMHEMGHIATTPPQVETLVGDLFGMLMPGFHEEPPRQLEIEAEAWDWAVDHAGRRLLRSDRELIAYSLSTYLISPFFLFGRYPIEDPPRKAVVEIGEKVGPVDFSKAPIMSYIPETADHVDDFDRAWNQVLLGLTSRAKEAVAS